ncbi:hypothetical protein [Burkholderia pseudomultivorans]|uniref:hypothetical protein n=1 Tax=Burkholderia pseudomultivorans TaxID=1207504 RepID=UPI0012D9A46B|nr:hypothetical protein [Burkholderia pseudomultivorans]
MIMETSCLKGGNGLKTEKFPRIVKEAADRGRAWRLAPRARASGQPGSDQCGRALGSGSGYFSLDRNN